MHEVYMALTILGIALCLAFSAYLKFRKKALIRKTIKRREDGLWSWYDKKGELQLSKTNPVHFTGKDWKQDENWYSEHYTQEQLNKDD